MLFVGHFLRFKDFEISGFGLLGFGALGFGALPVTCDLCCY